MVGRLRNFEQILVKKAGCGWHHRGRTRPTLRRFSPRLRPPIEKVERALSLQLAGGVVLDGVPPFVGGLDIASNVLTPAFGYRGRKVEIELGGVPDEASITFS
jgi:hypothetical protein